jgi:hypothetical protein
MCFVYEEVLSRHNNWYLHPLCNLRVPEKQFENVATMLDEEEGTPFEETLPPAVFTLGDFETSALYRQFSPNEPM